MGKINEIQEEVKQSYGSNSFTTIVKENTVEFDSAKDSFTFKDEVNVPSLKIDGEDVQAGPADWNDLKNKPFDDEEKSLWGAQVIRLAGNQLEGADEQGRVYFTPTKKINPGDSFTVIIGNEYKMVVTVSGTAESGGGGGSLVNIETGLPGLGGGSIVYSDYGQSGAIQLGVDPATVSGELSCTVEVVKQIDSKFIPKKSDVNRGVYEQGDYFKIYPDKYNVSVYQFGYDVVGLDIIADDSMKDGKCYTYEGVINLKSSVSLPISEDTIQIKLNGQSGYSTYSINKAVILSDNVPSMANDKRQVRFKIKYIYEQYGPLLFIEFIGMKQA